METRDDTIKVKTYNLMVKITAVSILFFVCSGFIKIVHHKESPESIRKTNSSYYLIKLLKN
jgi:hypothetical protein